MKVYDVHGSNVGEGIEVVADPYPHIVLGEGGNKRATWLALGKRDVEVIVQPRRLPCPDRGRLQFTTDPHDCSLEHVCGKYCERCNFEVYGPWKSNDDGSEFSRKHAADRGEIDGPTSIHDVGVVQLKDKEGNLSQKYLLVAPRQGDDRVLVLWRVSSGYRGSATITAGDGVTVVAKDVSWHSGRGNLGETAEMLAILKPGQELFASISGRRVQETEAKLFYNGEIVVVTFGDEGMQAATSDEVDGEYV